MVTTQMKTDAQRLGNGKKAFNVKQVEKMMESAGGSYTAGAGIDITEDVISADTEVLALKSELPDMSDYQEKLTAGDGINISNNIISATGKEWKLCTSLAEIRALKDNGGRLIKDVLFMKAYPSSEVYAFFFKKGTAFYNPYFPIKKPELSESQGNKYIRFYYFKPYAIWNGTGDKFEVYFNYDITNQTLTEVSDYTGNFEFENAETPYGLAVFYRD